MWRQVVTAVWFWSLVVKGTPLQQEEELSSDHIVNVYSPVTRTKRQSAGDTGGTPKGICEFGTNDDTNLCDWRNSNFTQLLWQDSIGKFANFLGGPKSDVSFGDLFGGYAFVEMSLVRDGFQNSGFESAMLISSKQPMTGPEGVCFQLWYFMEGLSPDRIRVLLHPVSMAEEVNDTIISYDGSKDRVLWQAFDTTQDSWLEANILIVFFKEYRLIIEAIPAIQGNQNRAFRGSIAIDNLKFSEASACKAFCSFEFDSCEWTQSDDDEFDWEISTGSQNPSTGPYRDVSSFSNPDLLGAFLRINSAYPRRPGDMARLMSTDFTATNPDSPLCLRFWTHMYGNGIGSLRVLLRNLNTNEDIVIWSLGGEAGNEWYQAQMPITSLVDFKLIFEGVVGKNDLGDIAIDDITVTQGACPSAPQVATGNPGHCSFEVDNCGWTNPQPVDRVDESDWTRVTNGRYPDKDHTLDSSQGSYMAMTRESLPRLGDRAWLVSATVDGSDDPMCIAFWYYMNEEFIDKSGPSLGTLSVLAMTLDNQGNLDTVRTLWSLKYHQGPNWLYGQTKVQSDKDFAIVFEGMWGSVASTGYMAIDDVTFYKGDCTTKPEKAVTSLVDNDFQRNSGLWTNTTTDPNFRWGLASLTTRPAKLPDHTFGGPFGYVYFDVFNQNGKSQTLDTCSPTIEAIPGTDDVCLSFWFAAFGSGSSTILSVVYQTVALDEDDEDGEFEKLWERTAEVSGSSDYRPDWSHGQITIPAVADFRACYRGQAKNGGYALDDIRLYQGSCKMRPKDSVPKEEPDENSDN